MEFNRNGSNWVSEPVEVNSDANVRIVIKERESKTPPYIYVQHSQTGEEPFVQDAYIKGTVLDDVLYGGVYPMFWRIICSDKPEVAIIKEG